jgi:predicted PurR-regulated permease PerM
MSFPSPTPKQARLIWAAVTGLAGATILTVIAGAIWGLGQALSLLSPVLWPLAVAGVFAYLLDPVVDFIERHRVPRARAILCVFALAAVIVLALFGSVVPQVVRETRQLAETIPRYAAGVQHQAQHWIDNPPKLLQKFLPPRPDSLSTTNAPAPGEPATLSTNTPAPPAPAATAPAGRSAGIDPEMLQSATAWLAKALPKVGAWLFGQVSKVASWFGVLAGLALIPVYAFYFLLEKEGIQQKWTDYLPVAKSEFKDELVFVLKSINDYLIAFFRGQVIVALCDGILYTIGFFIVGLPYAFLLGVLATVLTMIPFLGAITTCVAALIIAFAQFGDWVHPVLVLVVFGIVQALEGLVISPKIMGDRVGLHPLAIIIAVMVGTTLLGGLLGGILAIPLTAALRVVMFRYVWRKQET